MLHRCRRGKTVDLLLPSTSLSAKVTSPPSSRSPSAMAATLRSLLLAAPPEEQGSPPSRPKGVPWRLAANLKTTFASAGLCNPAAVEPLSLT